MPEIQGLLKEEMPREKLISLGPSSLTEVELLAIVLRVGTKNKNVLELSREILNSFSVSLISRKTYYDLLEFRGISKAKACQIVSVFELSRRLLNKGITNKKDKIQLNNSKSVFNFIKADYFGLGVERVMIIFINSKNIVVKKEFIFEGSINFSYIDIRKIIKLCVSLDVSGFFLIHNHPSGDLIPSPEDVEISKSLMKVCREMDIRFLDHLIVFDNDYYSMFDNDFL